MSSKVKRGKGKAKDHEGELEYLISFMGEELLMHIRRIAKVTCQRETLEVKGKILGGHFKVSVTFNGETKH